MAASGGHPESGDPGLNALLLCFWVIVPHILLLFILLLFIWRLRLSYLVQLLPRPRRVRWRRDPNILLLFLLLFFWLLRLSYLVPLQPRPRRVRKRRKPT